MVVLAGAATLAMLVSLLLTWAVRNLARKIGWMSGPESRRHVHRRPVPRVGGIAVYTSIGVTLVWATVTGNLSNSSLLHSILVPAALALIVGIADDLVGVSASRKLLAQIAAALCLFLLGARLPVPGFLNGGGWLPFALSMVLTTFWTVAVMNAVNLVDGLDGLASGSLFSSALGFLVLALIANDAQSALVSVVTAGSLAGFLCFNRSPASIFLGDSGSLVLGSLMAALSIRIVAELPIAWLACPIVLAHPFSEVAISVARRALRAEKIFRPDRRHLHHRLLDRGIAHRDASMILIAAASLCSVLGILAGLGGAFAVIATTAFGVLSVAAVCELRYGEFVHLGRWVRKAPRQRAVIAANLRLEELSQSIGRTRSMTELRILLSEEFASLGFESARLYVRSYDSASRIGAFKPATVALSFPLYADDTRLGALELRWDISAGNWPFDPEIFASVLLPSLCSKLRTFGQVYRELPSRIVSPRLGESAIIPVLAAQQAPLSVPLDC